MLNFLVKIVLMLTLIFGCLVVHDSEARSKVKLSKRYRPPGNPGGANFLADEEFAESYKLYEKRRELIKKKRIQGKANSNAKKEDIVKKLKEKKIASLKKESDKEESCMIDDKENDMVNQHGVNLTRLKGAVFIDESSQEPVYQKEDKQLDSNQGESEQLDRKQQEKKHLLQHARKKCLPSMLQ